MMAPTKSTKQQYNLRRDLLIAAGKWQPYIDAEPARQHINQLRAAGLGNKRIARLAGVSAPTVQRLLYGRPSIGGGPTRRIRPDIAAKILAVQADLDTLALVDATGTRRRSQALVCLGWSQGEQARRLGIEHRTFTQINASKHVTASRARAVRALYDELSMSIALPGQSSNYARGLAKRRGYAPPLAWDDDTIDDPAATPNLSDDVPRKVALVEDASELIAQGYTIRQAAERLQVCRSYLEKLFRAQAKAAA